VLNILRFIWISFTIVIGCNYNLLNCHFADETALTTSADETTTAFAATDTTVPLSRPVAPKPRLKPLWRSPVWDFFAVFQDKKFAKCEECEEVVLH